MTYIAAWIALSLLGCAVWFLLTPFTDDDDVYETNRSHDGPSLRPVHRPCFASDGGEENDAALGSLLSKAARGE